MDPATACGWAHSEGFSGTWYCHPVRDESKGMRLVKLYNYLSKVKDDFGIDLVIYESARNAGFGHQGALVVQSELQGVIKLWCEQNHVDYRGFSPTEVKKYATGKGNAKKPDMIAAAKAAWPHLNILDDNHADALWILDFARSIYGDLSLYK